MFLKPVCYFFKSRKVQLLTRVTKYKIFKGVTFSQTSNFLFITEIINLHIDSITNFYSNSITETFEDVDIVSLISDPPNTCCL